MKKNIRIGRARFAALKAACSAASLAVALGVPTANAATKADAEFVAQWDAVVGYCGTLQPAHSAQYQAGMELVFRNASPTTVADARKRPEYRPRHDAMVKQLKKTAAAAIASTCNSWVVAVNGVKPAQHEYAK